MHILAILKGIKEVAEIVVPILGWLKKKKVQKRARKIEAALSSVIQGVEQFATVNKNLAGVNVKTYIQSRAQADDTEKYLNPIVKSLTR